MRYIKRIQTIISVSRQAFAKYKWHIVFLASLGFIGGLLEGIGINALIPLFSMVIGETQEGADFITRQIQNLFNALHLEFSVMPLLILIAILFILKAVVSVILEYMSIRIITDYTEKVRKDSFEKILHTSWPYLLKQKFGYLETILMINVPGAASLLKHASGSLILLSTIFVYALVAINISMPITLITIVLGGTMLFIFKPITSRVKALAYEREGLNKELAHHISENVFGIKTVKAFMVQHRVLEKAKFFFEKFRALAVRGKFLNNISEVFYQPIGVIFALVIFALAYRSANFNPAALVAIIYLVDRMFIYFKQLQNTVQKTNDMVPHVRIILDYQQEASRHQESSRGSKPFAFEKELRFDNVKFAYDGGKPVLNGINFFISKGEMLGLIGPSGVGKTTLVDLILRLFEPSAGRILLDGIDISEIRLDTWRGNIGYVSQDIFLINDTIANNIRFYNESLSGEEVIEAAKMANIYEFIMSTEKKFESPIGDRGILLSAGQRQRIVIARVLARKPQILVLDEATSALDNESESKIQEVIESLKGKITVLIIAHRLSTVANADRLVVLDKGRIVEEGTPQKLLTDKSSYFFRISNLSEAKTS